MGAAHMMANNLKPRSRSRENAPATITLPDLASGSDRTPGAQFAAGSPAPIHRLVHHADVIALKGDSYRLKDRDLGRVPTATADEP